ncbi:MAG: spermine synthase [Bacilli bacterium]|nr:spermine synthase [Bacilli bacterium]
MNDWKKWMPTFEGLFPHTVIDKRSDYQRVLIRRKGQIQYLISDGASWQGAVDLRHPQKLIFRYQEAFLLHQLFLNQVTKFALIGVGAGTALHTVRTLYPGCTIDGVDFDPVMIDVALTHFNCPLDESTSYHCMDGLAYLEARQEPLDLLFVDAFYQEKLPTGFVQPQFFQQVKECLAPHGVVCINVITPVTNDAQTNEFRMITEQMGALFPELWLIPTSMSLSHSQNVILVGAFRPPCPRAIRYRGASFSRLQDYQDQMIKLPAMV